MIKLMYIKKIKTKIPRIRFTDDNRSIACIQIDFFFFSALMENSNITIIPISPLFLLLFTAMEIFS